jgi:hypothetical protein
MSTAPRIDKVLRIRLFELLGAEPNGLTARAINEDLRKGLRMPPEWLRAIPTTKGYRQLGGEDWRTFPQEVLRQRCETEDYWWNRTRFVRRGFKNEGLLADAPTGTWKLSNQGRSLAAAIDYSDLTSVEREILQGAASVDQIDEDPDDTSVVAPVEEVKRRLRVHPTLVLEGVPGTGKTHHVRELVELIRNQQGLAPDAEPAWDRVRGDGQGRFAITLHPATAYEDFVEGIRPSASGSRAGRNGAWAAQGRKPAVTPEQAGTWFWEDPPIAPSEGSPSPFSVEDGFFIRVCAEAVHFPKHDFVVLLDELNRCNLPKVLGDLLTTIEASKRATWSGTSWDVRFAQVVSLPYSGRLSSCPTTSSSSVR